MKYKYICYINGKAVILPKIICVEEPKIAGSIYTFQVAISGDEALCFVNKTLEESLIERDRLVTALEIMYQEKEENE